jgi:hypothetical protein
MAPYCRKFTLNRFAHQLHSYFLTGAPVNRPALRVARIVKEAS